MEDAEPEDDPFGVELEWPDEQLGKPFEPPSGAEAENREAAPEQGARPEDTAPIPRTVLPPVEPLPVMLDPEPLAAAVQRLQTGDGDATDLSTLLARIVARIDTLTVTISTYRNLTSERVSGYTERVAQMVTHVTRDAEEYRRFTGVSLDELRRDLGAVTATLDRVAASVEVATREMSETRAQLSARLDGLTNEVQTIRRRTSVRPRTAGSEEDRGRLRRT